MKQIENKKTIDQIRALHEYAGSDIETNESNFSDEIINTNDEFTSCAFETLFTREISNYSALGLILDRIKPLDFQLEACITPEKKRQLIQLRKEIEKCMNEKVLDDKKLSRLQSKLSKFPFKEKNIPIIIIENLMVKSELIKRCLGIINDFYYIFNGEYWENIDYDLIRNFITATATKSGISHFDAVECKYQANLMDQFNLTAVMPKPKVSPNSVMINLKNGTFVFDDGKFYLKPFDYKDMLLFQLPFEYNPDAEAPRFMKFLDEVVPEENAKIVICEYIAYIFAKHLKWEKCMVFLGAGGNGKSVLMNIIVALLGEQNVTHFSLGDLCDNKGYHRAEIENKLLNACSEIGASGSSPDMLKQICSNEAIGARSPFGKPITISNYARMLFCANNISNKDVEQTKGFFRKIIFLEFNPPVPKEKMNTNLSREIIESELSGVFNWVLKGLKSITQPNRHGFTHSEHIENARRKIEKDSNSVTAFWTDSNYIASNIKHVELKHIFDEYMIYCESANLKPVSRTTFANRLEMMLNITIKRKCTNNATWVYCTKNENIEEFKDPMLEKMFNL